MFSWFRKKPKQPPAPPSNPSPAPRQAPQEFVRGKIAFSSAEKSWEEEFDVIDIAAKVLDRAGRFATRKDNALTLDTSEYTIRPVMISFKPLDRGRGTQSCTITRITHPRLMPAGFFEFQHSMGATLNESLEKGFDDWTKTDLVPLLDALEVKPRQCTILEMTLPAKGDQAERRRRMILGPVAHLCQTKLDPNDPPEEHPFCPCCLLTNTMKAFMPIIETDGFFGLRLFAMRNEDGSASADCRINGEEFEPGKEALRSYVDNWPAKGFEFRKQYVVVQSSPE